MLVAGKEVPTSDCQKVTSQPSKIWRFSLEQVGWSPLEPLAVECVTSKSKERELPELSDLPNEMKIEMMKSAKG